MAEEGRMAEAVARLSPVPSQANEDLGENWNVRVRSSQLVKVPMKKGDAFADLRWR
jgi:hypothetical protein